MQIQNAQGAFTESLKIDRLFVKYSKSKNYFDPNSGRRFVKKKSFFQEIKLNISYLFAGAYFFGREP